MPVRADDCTDDLLCLLLLNALNEDSSVAATDLCCDTDLMVLYAAFATFSY
jgi:hypothetical protein